MPVLRSHRPNTLARCTSQAARGRRVLTSQNGSAATTCRPDPACGPLLERESPQPERVEDDRNRAEAHRRARDDRTQQEAEDRVEHARSDRHTERVVDEGEEKVLADIA